MIDDVAVGEALAALFRAGVSHWSILTGVAQTMSASGKQRLDIVDLFWRLMNASPPLLTEDQLMLVDDFTRALLGDCPLDQIVTLHGDPEDPRSSASSWRWTRRGGSHRAAGVNSRVS